MAGSFGKSFRTTFLVVGILGVVFFLEGVAADPRLVFWLGGSFAIALCCVGGFLTIDGTDEGKELGWKMLGSAFAFILLEAPLYYFGWA